MTLPYRFRLLAAIAPLLLPALAPGDDWPRWLGPNGDGIWRETGIVETFPEDGPPVMWKTPIGAGYAGPAVAEGRVFVMDRVDSAVRGSPNGPVNRTEAPGAERVVCLDLETGEILWTHRYERDYNISYPSGPRTTPAVAGGKVYTLGAEGDLLCLDIATGKPLWSTYFPEAFGVETQTWGVASSPVVDGDKLICLVGGKGQTVVAFDRHTGAVLWKARDSGHPGYSVPVIIEAGGARQLIAWTAEELCSLNPETGELYWTRPLSTTMAHAIATPRVVGDRVFVSSFFNGSIMMQLDADTPTATEQWYKKGRNERNPVAVQCLLSTPFIRDGYIYGVGGYGHLRCLRADTGERVWETLAATRPDDKPARWAAAFIIPNEDRNFLYNEHGELIIAKMDPEGYHEIARAQILQPTNKAGNRVVSWCHPAFAAKSVIVRNDDEIVRVNLAK